ncbi:NADH-quinone oxidoreductase subunit L [Sulfurimonas sp.]|uniref:NADH-quinone oxidoreductase subunit L n=1 Tax=Sulfurimonas sp. TaxID=2022749 RepID=UPI0025DD662B|nr:NADH-quinone oxidoreductase subunit L [Sulfurimonas sp.]
MSSFLLSWIVLVPLLSAIILGLLYLYSIKIKKLSNKVFAIFGLTSPFISFAIAGLFFIQMLQDGKTIHYEAYKWLGVGSYNVSMGFMADNLSIFMILFVTFVGGLIHVYASGYMKDDEGYGKFFFYFNFFLASMLLLVLADSPIIMFIGWEGVGLCSYLLISYYYKDSENVLAGNKAFIANRVGDFGFIVAMITMFYYAGANGFDYVSLQNSIGNVPIEIVTYIGIALFIGAVGKSAQIPLYVWLPDAMAGPTPVSALIHAATMVTAGVYMVARFHFVYELIPNVGLVIAYIGAFSALFAATIATKQTDIKKILAYSTMSQLGYMFIAVGLGSYSVGIFHVFTHAFFKALLFMGAGAVIVALHHEQNIFKMGGMKKHTPVVFFTMLIATLSIAGIPPFSGFFSKDEILLSAFASGEYLLWGIGVLTAIMTAYYMFRLFFVVFFGKNSSEDRHIVELPKSILIPLVILAVGSILTGFLGVPELLGGTNLASQWLSEWKNTSLHIDHTTESVLMLINVLAALVGIFIAYKKFYKYDMTKVPKFSGMIWNKFYIDEIYDVLFVRSIKRLSSFIAMEIDIKIIDSLLMGLSSKFISIGHLVARVQNANTRFYAFVMLCGISLISIYLIIELR